MINTVLIGLGSIGGQSYFSNGSANEFGLTTHVSVIDQSNIFNLVGIVDPDCKNKVKKEKQKFWIAEDVDDIADGEYDLFVIASPTSTHLGLINTIIRRYPKSTIFVEKPVISKIDELEDLDKIVCNTTQNIFINFHRNADPAFIQLKKEIKPFNTRPFNGSANVGGGLIHNGSHVIAFLCDLFGGIRAINPLEVKQELGDFFGSVSLDFGVGQSIVVSSWPGGAPIINMEILALDFKLSFKNDGSLIYLETPFKNNYDLKLDQENYLIHPYNELIRFYSGLQPRLIDMHTVLKMLERARK